MWHRILTPQRLAVAALLVLLLNLVLFQLASAQVRVQPTGKTDYVTAIAAAADELRGVSADLTDDLAEDERKQLRTRISGARSSATDALETMDEELALVAERETLLGPKPTGAIEPPDILAERQELTQRRGMLEAAIKRGRLVVVEAEQLADQLKADRTEQITNEIAQRDHSPLTPRYWIDFSKAAGGDLKRLGRLLVAGNSAVAASLANGWMTVLGLIAALILAWPGRLVARSLGQKYLIRVTPANRLRRSSYAVWRIVTETLLSFAAAGALVAAARWAGMIHPRWEPIATAFVNGVTISSFITSLAGAILMRKQTSWRLLPVNDAVAGQLRVWTWLLAALSLIYALLDAVSVAMSASPPAMTLMHIGMVAGQVVFFTGILMTLARLRLAAQAADNMPRHTSLALLTLIAWLVVIIGTLSVLGGYIAFSLFLVRLVAWLVIVCATIYVAWLFVDDISTNVFCGESLMGQWIVNVVGTRASVIDQVGVVLSGALRLCLALMAVAALLFPFGTGFDSVFEQAVRLSNGIKIGEVTLSPGAIFQAILVLIIGVAVVRLFKSWLNTRFLPKTEWDAGARNSVSVIAGYSGTLLVTFWAIASMGIGMERIALLLSALSVGIGFGLQAITQNFISGLILLTERPVRIGDWVKIGTDEGDIKKINVRATEIRLADHSTLIVPNSELITKTVLNKTHADPLGRIQVEFSIPIGADIAEVRTLVMSVFNDEPRVLKTPEAAVFIDRIENGRVMFNCFGHVASPREAYVARSAILIDLLQRLRAANIDVGTVPQRLELLNGNAPAAPDIRSRSDLP